MKGSYHTLSLYLSPNFMIMLQRRRFLQTASLGLSTLFTQNVFAKTNDGRKPIVISTWDAGIDANKAAWGVLRTGGRALDAVEQGVMVTENTINCCVGLGA